MLRASIFESIYKHCSKKEFTIMIGARQIGKTTILRQLEAELSKEGKDVVFLNLEKQDVLNALNDNPENIFQYCNLTDARVFVLIDEIQYLKNPSHFLKLLYDEYAHKLKLIVTGSSAFYLDAKFKDSLAGRKKIFELYTLSFQEFLHFRQEDALIHHIQKLTNGTIKKSAQAPKIALLLEEYILYGGYPAVVLEKRVEDKIEKLSELKNSYVKRDVLESGVRDEEKFYKLMQILASQTGGLLNINELSNTIRTTTITIEAHIAILQKCFHVQLLKPFFKNLRKELTKMPKCYFNDTGLRNALLQNFAPLAIRQDKGELFENFIFTQLRNAYGAEALKYWRTTGGKEVDFIINTMQYSKAIEVKFSDTENKINKYKKFIDLYNDIPFQFCNYSTIAQSPSGFFTLFNTSNTVA
jgi:uncharacterized protein